jgi:hypothetical protein
VSYINGETHVIDGGNIIQEYKVPPSDYYPVRMAMSPARIRQGSSNTQIDELRAAGGEISGTRLANVMA